MCVQKNLTLSALNVFIMKRNPPREKYLRNQEVSGIMLARVRCEHVVDVSRSEARICSTSADSEFSVLLCDVLRMNERIVCCVLCDVAAL